MPVPPRKRENSRGDCMILSFSHVSARLLRESPCVFGAKAAPCHAGPTLSIPRQDRLTISWDDNARSSDRAMPTAIMDLPE